MAGPSRKHQLEEMENALDSDPEDYQPQPKRFKPAGGGCQNCERLRTTINNMDSRLKVIESMVKEILNKFNTEPKIIGRSNIRSGVGGPLNFFKNKDA